MSELPPNLFLILFELGTIHVLVFTEQKKAIFVFYLFIHFKNLLLKIHLLYERNVEKNVSNSDLTRLVTCTKLFNKVFCHRPFETNMENMLKQY